MPDSTDIPITFKGTTAPWFVEPDLRRVFSGDDHGMKCVCAIGAVDFSRVTFAWTANPRDRLQRVAKGDPERLIVHEALWLPLMQSKDVLAELLKLLDRARVVEVDGWRRFPKRYLRPLMIHAADKAGKVGLFHREFHVQALETETLKLRARLAKAEVDPKVVAAHRYV